MTRHDGEINLKTFTKEENNDTDGSIVALFGDSLHDTGLGELDWLETVEDKTEFGDGIPQEADAVAHKPVEYARIAGLSS